MIIACFTFMIESFEFNSEYDGLKLSAIVVMPSGQPEALLQIAHGMCGGKDRFLPFMRYMAERGVACVANDHRGHGNSVRSDADLGYMYGGGREALVNDMRQLSALMLERFPDMKFYLLGHSMGSLAVRSYLKKGDDRLSGVILCGSPGYNPLARFGYALSRSACALGFGRTRPDIIQKFTSDAYNHDFKSEGDQAWTCSDPEVRKTFIEDPKHNFRFTLDGSKTLMELMLDAYEKKGYATVNGSLPVIFLSGEDDPCMGGYQGLDKAACVMRESGYSDVRTKTYPAMRHEILNEIGKERVWKDIVEFMSE